MTFTEKLQHSWKTNKSLVCVGLDPHISKLPQEIQNAEKPFLEFNKLIIDATHDLVCAYKPQFAYYAGEGRLDELLETIQYIKTVAPNVPVILDSKRGDIGSTAAEYAREAFEYYQADAVTVNPYMGGDTLEPFTEYTDKGVIVLCKTSNPGSGDLQNLLVDGEKKLFEVVAEKAANEWNKNKNISLVVGATWPEELESVRSRIGDMPLLVPGVGSQGGDAKTVLEKASDSNGYGLMVNSSRGIIFAYQNGNEKDVATAARNATIKLKDMLSQ